MRDAHLLFVWLAGGQRRKNITWIVLETFNQSKKCHIVPHFPTRFSVRQLKKNLPGCFAAAVTSLKRRSIDQ